LWYKKTSFASLDSTMPASPYRKMTYRERETMLEPGKEAGSAPCADEHVAQDERTAQGDQS
jgi:hypothetical protein